MSKTFKPEMAAAVIVEALYSSDAVACGKFGITQRSLQNYRRRLSEDRQFSLIFAQKKAEYDSQWADELPGALRESLILIHEAAHEVRKNPTYLMNPMVLQAVAGAMKLCAEVHFTKKIIDARLAEQSGTANALPEQVPSGERPIEYEN